MKKESKQSKIAGIIIVVIAVLLLGQAIFYSRYSRREYLIYLAQSRSDINILSEKQISKELNNVCLPKLNKEETAKYNSLLKDKDNLSEKICLEACRKTIKEAKTRYTISLPKK